MEPRTLNYIAATCAGELIGGPPETLARRVCTDSRLAEAGDLFIALEGEKFDGHDFLASVAEKGAAAVVVNRSKAPPQWDECPMIMVENTRRALGQLATQYRLDFAAPMIAVAGSNGKTTTKDLVASVLREGLPTLASQLSFNNDIGVPLTLLGLESSHRAAVLEVGTNHPGELAPLVAMIRPLYGVMTSIGREHLEFFGDLDGVAKEEGQLAELLPLNGKLFVNGDSPHLRQIEGRTSAQVVRAGTAAHNEWRARDIQTDAAGLEFQVDAPDPEYAGQYELKLLGRHQAVNALFAIAVGREFGLSRAQIRAGLAKCRASKMRLQLWLTNNVRVLDDSYNANADSMRAALETLRDFPCWGRRVAVLGDMAELGAHGLDAHAEVGRLAAELGADHLFAVGSMAAIMGRAARDAGLSDVREFSDVDSAAKAVRDFVRPDDVVLLKASRATRLERVGEALRTTGSAMAKANGGRVARRS